MDDWRIDSHKLIYHVERVNDWLKGKNIYPIYLEISLCGKCNQRCIFCSVDYTGHKPNELDVKYYRKFIAQAARSGVKSVMFAGSGEPLLHKKFSEIVSITKKIGMDVAVTSNGVMFNEDKARKCLKSLSWVRISLDAGTARTYSKIHRAKAEDFNVVLNNLKNAVRIRNAHKYECTIGAQFLLLPQNANEMTVLARKLREIGVDYLIIKPYSQHPLSVNRLGERINYKRYIGLQEKVERCATRDFKIVFRKQAMKKINNKKSYKKSFGLSFCAYLSEDGDIYPCIEFLGNKKYILGNIYKQSFKDVWQGDWRKSIMNELETNSAIMNSQRLTRMEEINEYLWNLKNPPKHVNFI